MTPQTAIPPGLVEALAGSRHVVVLTGSGISAESGVPTFRDAGTGLWARYEPTDLATPEAFSADPGLVWRWYRWRRGLVAAAEPNPAHLAVARLADCVPRLTLITQNVDGLHQRAGSRDVIEFHGNLFADVCSAGCGTQPPVPEWDELPCCHRCGALLRPGVVWFGEGIPPRAVEAADAACGDCDLFLSIGTSSQVWPAAGLAGQAARGGAVLVEINPEATPLSSECDYCLAAPAGTVLPKLVDCVARGAAAH